MNGHQNLAAGLKSLPGDVHKDVLEWFNNLPDDISAPILEAKPTLGPLLSTSPFLKNLAERHATWLAKALEIGADTALQDILRDAASAVSLPSDQIAKELRIGKAKTAFLAAVAETGGVWTTEQSTGALSDYADTALHAALGSLMHEAAEAGKITLAGADGVHPAAECGLAIFALGKHGGQELNYSSDIDIVAFYDVSACILQEPDEANSFYTRIVRRLIAIMEERDGNGIVFRTDLRLRPDPGATPLALGVGAAMQYYESRGQNWERAAWIKARPCAGDLRVGESFLTELSPFIWRKHLDFATVEEIQTIKRQINLARSIGDEKVESHNVKLGRGGIREIEFFAQTQQLIAGGRDLALRVRPTISALKELADGGWISAETAQDLSQTYWYLRAVENRLQMRGDEQVHTLPATEEEVTIIAQMMGDETVDIFKKKYRAATARVTAHYAALFSQADDATEQLGELVFTGSDDDPATLEALSDIGFSDPARASATIRKWHYGGYAATRAAVARTHLTQLLPSLLSIISASGNADKALVRFDDFVSRLPAGVQLFALLRAHEKLARLLVLFMASAPRLADEVIQRTHIVDGLIDPTFADDLNKPTGVADKVDAFLGDAISYEELFDRARIIGQEQKFLISAGLVSTTISSEQAGKQFGMLAQRLLGVMFAAVRREFEIKHGIIPQGRVALLAFGKLASMEMSATSDIDFILLYDVPKDVESSDGDKPLDPAQYYARLTQRLLAGLSAPTATGVLYEADMRLRPSGRAGPLATSFTAFKSYQKNSAWTWEHLALSRARVVCADDDFGTEIHNAIDDVLSAPIDARKAVDDVIAMREKLLSDRSARHNLDLKLVPGGIVDIEFIAQSAQIIAYKKLNVPRASVIDILKKMQEIGFLNSADRLIEISKTYSAVSQVINTCASHPDKIDKWSDAFKITLAQLLNVPNFEFLETDLISMRADVSAEAERWYELARKM